MLGDKNRRTGAGRALSGPRPTTGPTRSPGGKAGGFVDIGGSARGEFRYTQMPEGDSDYYSKPIHIETGAAKKRDRVRYMFLLFAVLWAGIIFYASSIPADGLPSDLGNLNVLGHFVEYLVLAVLLWFAWKDKWKNTVNYLMVTAAICALYAASDEIHQYFVPGRQTDFLDWVVDVLGAGVGLCGAVAAHIFGGFGLRRR